MSPLPQAQPSAVPFVCPPTFPFVASSPRAPAEFLAQFDSECDANDSDDDEDVSVSVSLDSDAKETETNSSSSRRPKFIPPKSASEITDGEETHRLEDKAPLCQRQQLSLVLYLTTLPSDTIHLLSSFLTVQELANLSICSKQLHGGMCRDVFSKMRMHAVRCLGELMLAWATGEHTDARELAALYIQNGVPIYPAPHGHSYHTIAWRMGLEVKEMIAAQDGGAREGLGSSDSVMAASTAVNHLAGSSNNYEIEGRVNEMTTDGTTVSRATLDPFYATHFGINDRTNSTNIYLPNQSPFLTYVEEKALFWKENKGIPIALEQPTSFTPLTLNYITPNNSLERRRSFDGSNGIGGLADAVRVSWQRQDNRFNDHLVTASNRATRRSSFSGLTSSSRGWLTSQGGIPSPTHPDPQMKFSSSISSSNYIDRPKMTLRIHRHLADRHFFNQPSVAEDLGNMDARPINLNADFFHPHWDASTWRLQNKNPEHELKMTAQMIKESMGALQAGNDNLNVNDQERVSWEDIITHTDPVIEAIAHGDPLEDDIDMDQSLASRNFGLNPSMDNPYRAATFALTNSAWQRCYRRHSMQRSISSSVATSTYDTWSPLKSSATMDVHLEIYSSSSNPKLNIEAESYRAITAVRARVSYYQRRLESFLAQNDSKGFEDCLLDWWDEILPKSAGIHFYNRESPVPRMSKLHTFLTTPCPKAIGIVKCEIERVKISSKKKGPNVKGRFFPTYEYRLFIRDVKNDNPQHLPNIPPRRDTVLFVAKGKSQKGRNSIVSLGMESPSKQRGLSQFYLCLPQQRDVDMHFKSANKGCNLGSGEISGMPISPIAADSNTPVTIGRLQSNFIGTEFQIFSPLLPNLSKSSERSIVDQTCVLDEALEEECLSPKTAIVERGTTPSAKRQSQKGNGLARFARRASFTVARRGSLRMHRNNEGMNPVKDDDEVHYQKKSIGGLPWGSLPGSGKKSTRTKRRAIANAVDSDGQCPQNFAFLGEEENGAIAYTANLLGNRPRIMDVCIPKISEDGSASNIRHKGKMLDSSSEDGDATSINNRMLNRLKAIQQQVDNTEENDANGILSNGVENDDHGLMILQNRPPWWNMELGAFVLNFGGRVSVASVKNFQLCERSNQDFIMLQFGRIQGRHAFTMDFQHPLTPLQAFAIAISSLQSKISFG